MTAMLPKLTDVPALAPRPGEPFRFTREQYLEMDRLGFFRDVRVQRIRGEIVVMSAVNWPHLAGVRKTRLALEAAFAGIGWVNDRSPLPTPDSDPEPDLSVIPGRFEDYSDHPTTALLVVEVSASTLFEDTTTMAEVYATAAAPEYWVVDVLNRRLLVYRDPRPLPPGGVAYRSLTELGESDTVSPLAAPAAQLRVADLLP
jgi:Uma2 family endonuclease